MLIISEKSQYTDKIHTKKICTFTSRVWYQRANHFGSCPSGEKWLRWHFHDVTTKINIPSTFPWHLRNVNFSACWYRGLLTVNPKMKDLLPHTLAVCCLLAWTEKMFSGSVWVHPDSSETLYINFYLFEKLY